ncbi:MAG: hypothetical protein M3R46_13810 [Actinomycetota bacterium]|nr:hypothetical protein [Actinomycetota bacterium]
MYVRRVAWELLEADEAAEFVDLRKGETTAVTTLSVIGLAALVGVLCVALLAVARRNDRRREGASPPASLGPAGRAPPRIEARGTEGDEHEFRLRDPSGRELLAQLIDKEASVLLARADSVDADAPTPFAWDKALGAVPPLAAALKGGKWVRILNPEVLNTQRPHRSLNRQTPAERLAERTKTVAAYI